MDPWEPTPGPTCCVGSCCGPGSYCCGHPDNVHEHTAEEEEWAMQGVVKNWPIRGDE